MDLFPRSENILEYNRTFIPGGMSSANRLVEPHLAFVSGKGSRIWDADGNEYIDYHGAFSPQILGYRHADVDRAVVEVIESGRDLFGSGPTELEGQLAELICTNIGWVDKVVFLNSGSEATAQAIRLARAATSRDHIIVIQGGYNGWHNDVACNLMTPIEVLGPRKSPGEYACFPISGGIPKSHQELVHPINFSDLESVYYVCRRHDIAALIVEPILQNIGLIEPMPGYLEGLRDLANEFGFALIFDEVKTGFRHGFGGYAEQCGVAPDLAVYGKAIANGYPLSAIAGSDEWMSTFGHTKPEKSVLVAGTYNAHPIPLAASYATLSFLLEGDGSVYRHMDRLGRTLESQLVEHIRAAGVDATVVRHGSAFVLYFMDHPPVDWHDLASCHDNALDAEFRRFLIDNGIYFFPVPTKQCSISAAHSLEDIETTASVVAQALSGILSRR